MSNLGNEDLGIISLLERWSHFHFSGKGYFYSVHQLSHFVVKMYWKLNGLKCQSLDGNDNDYCRNWGQDQDQHFDI